MPPGPWASMTGSARSDLQRLSQEAAKGMAAARAAGIGVAEEDAIKWITINAAWALGLDDRIGSIRSATIEPGGREGDGGRTRRGDRRRRRRRHQVDHDQCRLGPGPR